MSDDLSDEEGNRFMDDYMSNFQASSFMDGWRECRRRSLVMIRNEIEHCRELRMDLEEYAERTRFEGFKAGFQKSGLWQGTATDLMFAIDSAWREHQRQEGRE